MPNPRPPFDDARWIWPDSQSWDLHNAYALFRHAFDLPAVPRLAPLFITADQSYQLYVNGRYVCRGPARGFQSHWPYDEVDVAAWLHPGPNLLAVRAHHPGFSNFQYLTQGYAGLLVAARWGEVRLASDPAAWRGRRQDGVRTDTVPASLQLFSQEHIDLRREPPDWMQPGHDDTGWTAPLAACVWNSMPWASLEARGIPLLDERADTPAPLLVGRAEGRCAPGFLATRDAARFRHGEGLRHEPCRAGAAEIDVPPTDPEGFRSFLLDYGRPVVGSLGFEIDGAAGGETVDTLHFETVAAGTATPDYTPDTHSRVSLAHRLVCRPGAQTHFFYHAFGCRYVVVTVRGAAEGLRLRPRLRTAVYPLEVSGGFRCADAALQGVWDTCAWTQRVCSLDAFVDTPWREQAQWWGDARVQAKNTFFLAGDTRLFRRGIAQIAAQRTPNGLTYGHAPTVAHGCILPDFSLIWLLTLWDHYWQTGSTEAFAAHGDAADAILGYFRDYCDPKTGLVRYDPRYWLFLDWTDLHRTGVPTVLNLWLVLALDKLALLCRETGQADRAAGLERWAGELRGALAELVSRDGLLRDGYDDAGRVVEEASIHGQVLALMAGLPGVSRERALAGRLLPFVRGEREFRASPSAYWITYVFELLREEGYGREVVDCIRRRWSPMTAQGSTWENFVPTPAHESYSHAWSAHPLYHLAQTLGGVVQTAPGWRRVRFEPCFAVASCETAVPTPLGMIRTRWQRGADGETAVRLELPPGTEAEVVLPGVPREVVSETRSWQVRVGA